jgi:hypothetical protein
MQNRTRTTITAVIVLLGVAAGLYNSAFFYTADGVMSTQTAVRLGLLEDGEAGFSRGLVFKKSGNGGYDYREGRVIAFIGGTSHTNIDLVAECERLGGCQLR